MIRKPTHENVHSIQTVLTHAMSAQQINVLRAPNKKLKDA